MRTIVPLVALWAVTAAVTRWCWKTWRRGNDSLWAARWGSMGWTLLIGDLAVMTTLAALNVVHLVTETVSVVLLLAAAGCAVAKPVATRRADTSTRSLRSGLGLPVARPLWRPMTVGAWWLAGGTVSMAAWLVSDAFHSGHDAPHPAFDAPGGSPLPQGFMAAGVVLTFLALAHCAIQEERIRREQRRVRAAEQHYLTHNPTSEADHPN
ncbi:hypothetical protein N4G70_32200 [Streptomyces sp. ASQP_92]|uniref:hypothetical protein n=1 Tax=Streptomyces sp. ASQP_92 TaxID=2979116 RepID=UPI0021BFAFB4|nr:hypothetical protein [Streptomyces sp. ASQP_92]MCT9093496.1 hypothetical protein [Streptomyces sp. ASQP_92]